MNNMSKMGYLIAIPTLALNVGCTNMTPTEQHLDRRGDRYPGGAAIGGLTGGNAGVGAVIGGAAGAVVGNIYGQNQQKKNTQRNRY